MSLLTMILAMMIPMAEAKDPFALETQAYLGVTGGLSVPDAPDTTERAALGLQVGAKLSDELSVGGFFSTSEKGERSATEDFGFRYAAYGVEANYHFNGSAVGAHLGGRLGLGRVTKDVASRTYSASPLVYGLQGGYDLMLNPHFSIGAEVGALFFNAGKKDPTTGLEVGAFGALSFIAAFKIWI